MTLTDQLSSGLKNIGSSVKDFQASFNSAGRAIQQVGRSMSWMGASIVGPFTASFLLAGKVSLTVADQIAKTQQTLSAFNLTLAETAVPSVKKFNEALSLVVKSYQDLDPKLRETITTWTLTAGAILLSAGAVTIFLGALVKLIPILEAYVALMIALEATKTKTGSSFAKGGFFGLGAMLGSDPKQVGADLQTHFDRLKALMDEAKKGMDVGKEIQKVWGDVWGVLSGNGNGSNLDKAKIAMAEFGRVSQQAIQSVASTMSTALGDTLFNAVTGKISSLKQVFYDFGNSVGHIIMNMIAKMMLIQTVGAIFPSTAQYFHSGGIIRAHSGLAPDEIPIIAQSGEGIVSRKGMATIGGSDSLRAINSGKGSGGGGMTVIVQQTISAWDASDVYRNRKLLSSAVANEIKNNGQMRQTMNNYR